VSGKQTLQHSASSPLHWAGKTLPVFYDPDVSISKASSALNIPETRLQAINPRCIAALYVIFTNAMRASEYLLAAVKDIVGNDALFIHGRKGSASYIIRTPGIKKQFKEFELIYPAWYVSGCTYRQLWAACVRIGLGDRVSSRENCARTHAARYRLAASLETKDLKAVADCLRHRSQRSTIHYMPLGGK